MEVNQEFERENDQLQLELKKYWLFELPIRSSDDDTRSNKRKSSKSKRSQKSKRKGKSCRWITRSKGKHYKSGSEGKSKEKRYESSKAESSSYNEEDKKKQRKKMPGFVYFFRWFYNVPILIKFPFLLFL